MNSIPEAGTIFTEIKNSIAVLAFAHPASNALTINLLQEITTQINQLSQNPNVVVIVIKSEGANTFCAGANFDELLKISNLEEGKIFFSGFANVINAIRKSPKIIVARVQGKSVGGGIGIIAACDYAMATINSSIKLSEIAIGIGPFVIEPAVSRKIGKTAFTALTLSPDQWKNADWAKQKGLFAEVFDTTQQLDTEIENFTKKLASYNPEALVKLKNILWEDAHNWDELLVERAEISGKLVLSDFTKNALKKAVK